MRLLAMQLDHRRVVLSERPGNLILSSSQSQLRRKTLDLFNIWRLVATGVAVPADWQRDSTVVSHINQSFESSNDNVPRQRNVTSPL